MFEAIVGVMLCTCVLAGLISARRSEPMLGWFLVQYDVPDSAATRSVLRAQLFRTRAWRVAGAFAGLTLGPVAFGLAGRDVPLLACIGLGWMIGGLFGEITGHRPRSEDDAAATVPSLLRGHDLLPRAARHSIVGTVLITLLALGMAVAARWSPAWLDDDKTLPPAARLLTVATVSVALALVSWRGVRSICRQPLRVTGNELDLVEHAIRIASSVRLVAGWGALQLLATGWLSWQTADITLSPVSWLAGAVSIGALVGAIVSLWWMPAHLTHHGIVGGRDNTGPIAST